MATDLERRKTIEEHWAASERGDVEVEHRLSAGNAVLDYPQSGERFAGRSSIMEIDGDLVARETQYFADPFDAPLARAQLAQRMDLSASTS